MVKRVVLAILLISSTAYASQTAPAKKDVDGEFGRYQLFQGTYTTFDLRRSETYSATAVFLIDSKTGVVKRYVNKIDSEGRYIEEWVPTERVQDKK